MAEKRNGEQYMKDISAIAKVTGEARYSADIELNGMLHAKLLKSPHPHAKIVSVDASAAIALPGVALVLTKDDYPALFPETAYFIGSNVALAVATDVSIAEEALELIKVEYEILPFIADPEEARKKGATKTVDGPLLLPVNFPDEENYPNVFRNGTKQFVDMDENGHYTRRTLDEADYDGFGDMEEARKEVDVFVESEYAFCKAQAPIMALSGCVVDYHHEKLDIYTPAQASSYIRMATAHMFNIPMSKINVITYATGGGFGCRPNSGVFDAKNDASFVHLAAAASLKLGKPVRFFFTREEEFLYYWGRSGMRSKTEIGFKKDGTLITMESEVWRNVSTAGGNGLATFDFDGTATGNIMYAHNCKANRLRKYHVLTNGPVFTGWQGYGNPEVFFLIESTMDDAAEKLGIDPLELRKINHMREGDNYLGLHYRFTGPHWLGHTGLDKCLEKGAELVRWHERRPASEKTGVLRHGKGVAVAAQQNCGEGVYAAALVKLDSDGTATLINNYMDMGQGGRTAQTKIIADVLGLSVDKVTIAADESTYTPYTQIQSCSSGMYINGNAAYYAAEDAKKKLFGFASQVLGGVPEEMFATKDGMIFMKDNPAQAIPWIAAFAASSEFGPFSSIQGYADYISKAGPRGSEQSAVFVDLDVDTETGKLKNIVATHVQDCGRAIFRRAVAANYLGTHHGLEACIAAEQILDMKTGKLLNDSFADYAVATILDHSVTPVIVEVPDPTHPMGLVGVGQANQNGIGAAVNNAIFNAIGVHITHMPFTRARILAALGKI